MILSDITAGESIQRNAGARTQPWKIRYRCLEETKRSEGSRIGCAHLCGDGLRSASKLNSCASSAAHDGVDLVTMRSSACDKLAASFQCAERQGSGGYISSSAWLVLYTCLCRSCLRDEHNMQHGTGTDRHEHQRLDLNTLCDKVGLYAVHALACDTHARVCLSLIHI